MENQHRKITGYRELNEHEVALMNEIKAYGPQLQDLLSRIGQHIDGQHELARNAPDGANLKRLYAANPFAWLSIAKTDFQTALMALTRAVAQPTSF